MNDLISRQMAIKAIHDAFDECLVWDESGECTANEVERILDELLTADAVEVVRCNDCKYCNYYSISDDFTCRYWDWPTKENGYCHIGEKSEYTAREWEAKYNNYYDKAALIKGVKDEQTL